MALNGLFCADVPLRKYSLTHCVKLCIATKVLFFRAHLMADEIDLRSTLGLDLRSF